MRKLLILTLFVAVATSAGAIATAANASSRDEIVIGFPHLDVDARYLSDYGFVKADGRSHRGIDIFSPKGTPVVAVADGQVITMGRAARSGFFVVIAHADGLESWYMHLNNDVVRADNRADNIVSAFVDGLEEGDYVRAGDVVAFVGDSGNAEATSPHTHFELHLNGRAIDPYWYVRDGQERWELAIAIAEGETPFR